MIFLYAFLIGGAICMLAQVVLDLFELTPGVITAIFVMLGAVLEFFDIYDKLIKFSGAGALLPITSFGHSLADGAYNKAVETNFLGIFTGMFSNVSAGITFAIVLSVLTAVFFKPKE
jgi:stage V sporulation protein AE